MTKIILGNVYSQLSDCPLGREDLDGYFSVPFDGYWFSEKFKAGMWDGHYHFFKWPSMKFPTGLLFLMKKYLNDRNIKFVVVDKRNLRFQNKMVHLMLPDFLHGITLRDYQLDSIETAVNSQRGVLKLATGSGKTEIAIGISKILNRKTLFLVNTKDLLHQTVKRFNKRLGIDIGIVGDGEFAISEDIVVATVQTLHSLFNKDVKWTKAFLNQFEVLILDECHHASSNTWFKVGMFMHNAHYRFGFSGTPLQRDDVSNMKVMAITGDIIYDLSATDLIARGDLSDIEIKIIKNDERILGAQWQEVYEKAIVKSFKRNTQIVEIARKEFDKKKKIMILVRYIEHGKILSTMLNSVYNIPVKFVHGATSTKEREKIKSDFNRSGKFILIASPIFDEGVDLPEINVLIMASGGKSEVKTIQKVGRGLRKKKDGSCLIVYDFDDCKSDYVSKHSLNRFQTYKKEGFC